jgi:GAF domain-containing protein
VETTDQAEPAEPEERRQAEGRLRQDLAELLKSHRQQGRLLARNQKLIGQLEEQLAAGRERVTALESELSQMKTVSGQQLTQINELEALVANHETIKSAYEAIDRERADLSARLGEVTRSRDNLAAERERMAVQLSTSNATLAARDAEVASLKNDEDEWKKKVQALSGELEAMAANSSQLKAELEHAAETEIAHARLELEFTALSARWDVARAQLSESEQALKSSHATIKAAQRLSASVEWRGALDGILDAASELVRFERGTLALVDELQEDLKVEAARNSPIAISEMSRFKVGEGIAGWALSHRQPVLVKDSRSDPRFKQSDPKHQPRSFLAVPLLADKDGLGVLTLARPASDPFDEQDLRSLTRVAADASNALINARLVQVLKMREDRLTTLIQKARDLWSVVDMNQVLDFVLTNACDLVGGQAALIAVRNPKTMELQVLGSQGIPADLLSQPNSWGAPAAAEVMRSGKPWVSPMADLLPPALVEKVAAAQMRMLVSVPCGHEAKPQGAEGPSLLNRSELEGAEEVGGVIHVYRQSTDALPQAEIEQLQAFAEQAAVAINNVRRWERVKDKLQATASVNARLMGRERYISQLHYRIQQLEQELSRFKAA